MGRARLPEAGALDRAEPFTVDDPAQWIGDAGLECVWRLAVEPRKMWKRDIIDGPRFIAAALADLWSVRVPAVRR